MYKVKVYVEDDNGNKTQPAMLWVASDWISLEGALKRAGLPFLSVQKMVNEALSSKCTKRYLCVITAVKMVGEKLDFSQSYFISSALDEQGAIDVAMAKFDKSKSEGADAVIKSAIPLSEVVRLT